MALLASEVLDHAAGSFLNDPSKGNYTYAKLLPHLQTAMLELQSALLQAGISTLEVASTTLTIPNTNTTITSSTNPALPTDLLLPMELGERVAGSAATVPFDPMHEREELPQRSKAPQLIDWTWENEVINFVGATGSVEVKIWYQRTLETVTGTASPINTLGSKLFLSARTAALAALFIGRNKELAAAADSMAVAELSKLITSRVKETQNFPQRRLPYNFYKRAARRSILRGR